MATEIPGSVIASLAPKLDTLELTEEEHAALAVVLAAGLEAGRERPEVEGYMPTAVELSPAVPFGSQLGGSEYTEIKFNYTQIQWSFNPGAGAADDWEART